MPLILPHEGTYVFEEKRSKFLGYCAPVSTEEAAREVIQKIRAAHPKANHHVFAYATTADNITRMSDDGEPSGTAGMPILTMFTREGIINYVCVVTRYFGGTLLGTGGLVKAYTHAAKGAMEAAQPHMLILYTTYRLVCEYNRFDKLKYDLEKQKVEILGIDYTDKCMLVVKVTEAQAQNFHASLSHGILKEVVV